MRSRHLTATAVALLMAAAFPAAAAAAAAEVSPAAPRMDHEPKVALSVAWQVQLRGLVLRPCGGLRAPCTRTSRAGMVVAGRVAPAASAAGLAVRIERRHRAPGTTTYAPRRSLVRRLAADGSIARSLLSPGVLPRAGSWCYRLVVPATAATFGAMGAWRCVRWRPPITVGWAGDIAMGSAAYGTPPGDGRAMFAGVRAQLRAPDLMVGNYEGTLSTGGTPRCSGGALCYVFQAPPRMASGLRHAGFDAMNLANNHGLDMGRDARAQTVRALAERGIASTGLPGQVRVLQVADTRVALVGFAWTPGTMDLDDAALVRRMVLHAGRIADVVVVLQHSGTEGAGAAHVPYGDEAGRGDTRRFTAVAIAAGADVVFGSGPHVVRGVEQRRRRLAFYSTGNFAGWHNFARGGTSSQSGIVTATLQHTGTIVRARWIGVRLVGAGLPVLDRRVVARVRALSRTDFGSRAARISRTGRIVIG